jgi:hypothetical protein
VSLWRQPGGASTPLKPQLWEPASDTLKGLLEKTESLTLEDMRAARRGANLLWSNERSTEPKFSDFSHESARSKKDTSARTLPEVDQGLWRKRVQDEVKDLGKASPLWGETGVESTDNPEPEKSSKTVSAAPGLWTKDGKDTPLLFTNVSADDTIRSKKDTSTATLPTFSESLWRRQVSLPPHPSLWTVKRRSTGLWDAAGDARTLKEIAIERQRSQKLLWSQKTASRTTDAKPERSKVSSKPTTIPLTKVAGGLWTKKQSPENPGLWKRNVRRMTVALDTVPQKVPLWAKETARRTTTKKPERMTVKKSIQLDALPDVFGDLWEKRYQDSIEGLWDSSRRNSEGNLAQQLWSQYTPTRTAAPKPTPDIIPQQAETVKMDVLWTSRPRRASLWEAPQPSTGTPSPQSNYSYTWRKETASRTTEAKPSRSVPVPRKNTGKVEKARGMLWGSVSPPLEVPRLSRGASSSEEESAGEQEGTKRGYMGFVGLWTPGKGKGTAAVQGVVVKGERA